MRLPPFNPYIAVLIGVLAISTSAILVKLAVGVPASMIAFYRLFFAIVMMAPFVLTKYRHQFQRITRTDWLLALCAGVFLALHFILWFESLNYTSVASSVVLVSMQPIFAFIGTYIFFQERFSPGAIISMIITVLGSIIISWGDFQVSFGNLFGDILALLGALTMTVYFLLGQQARRRVSFMTYTFIVYLISTLTLFVYNVALQEQFFTYSANHWLLFILLAIVPTFLGHSLFNWALRWLSTSVISMATVFEPIGASILAYFILDERISYSQWLGGTIVIFGLFLFIVSTSRKRKVTLSQLKDHSSAKKL